MIFFFFYHDKDIINLLYSQSELHIHKLVVEALEQRVFAQQSGRQRHGSNDEG